MNDSVKCSFCDKEFIDVATFKVIENKFYHLKCVEASDLLKQRVLNALPNTLDKVFKDIYMDLFLYGSTYFEVTDDGEIKNIET